MAAVVAILFISPLATSRNISYTHIISHIDLLYVYSGMQVMELSTMRKDTHNNIIEIAYIILQLTHLHSACSGSPKLKAINIHRKLIRRLFVLIMIVHQAHN